MPMIYQNVEVQSNARPKQIFHTLDGRLVQGVTLAANQGVLEVGQVIGLADADGKGMKFNKDASDGSEKAVGILLEHCDTDKGEVYATMALKGVFRKSQLVGLTDEAIAALNARVIDALDMVII